MVPQPTTLPKPLAKPLNVREELDCCKLAICVAEAVLRAPLHQLQDIADILFVQQTAVNNAGESPADDTASGSVDLLDVQMQDVGVKPMQPVQEDPPSDDAYVDCTHAIAVFDRESAIAIPVFRLPSD